MLPVTPRSEFPGRDGIDQDGGFRVEDFEVWGL